MPSFRLVNIESVVLTGKKRVRIIRPQGAEGLLPAIVYMHGGGWVLGTIDTVSGSFTGVASLRK